jgi:hypothetical protein
VKPYFKKKLHDSRTMMKIRSKMCPTVKMNFRRDKKFTGDQWSCFSFGEQKLDSQDHSKVCLFFEDLRRDKDLSSDQDIVTYFQEIIKRRQIEN